jgi:hypothetical protein
LPPISSGLQSIRRSLTLQLMKYLRGEPSGIQPGTINMTMAEIAKKLVEKDAALLLPANRSRLSNEMDVIFEREFAASIESSARQNLHVKLH